MSIVEELAFGLMDFGAAPELEGLKEGDIIKNAELTISSKRKIKLYDVLQNGPLLLVFIRGTWCPFCRLHMKRLRDWLEQLNNKKGTCIIVSSEAPEVIQAWLDSNPTSQIYASDMGMALAKYFGVYVPPKDFSQAATFLVDVDKSVKMTYRGKRTKKNFEELEKGYNKTKKGTDLT